MSIASLLPTPIHTPTTSISLAEDAPLFPNVKKFHASKIPLYGYRKGWVPRAVEDFEDGGAFPEIHVAQYPLDMVII